jgi:LPS-assembly protein
VHRKRAANTAKYTDKMPAFRQSISTLMCLLCCLGSTAPSRAAETQTKTAAATGQYCENGDTDALPPINYDALPPYYQHWFWVPDTALDDSPNCERAPGCQGRFVEPPRDWPGADLDPVNAPLEVSAESIESLDNSATMTGDVELRKGSLSLDAGFARYNRADSTVVLKDDVLLRQPGILLRGQYAELDTVKGLGELQQAEILSFETGARGTAGRIARPSYDLFLLEKASYTQCTPDNETWSLHAGRIELDFDSGRGVARNTTIKIHDIPIFYSPYLNFPVDDRRATGFLFPTLGVTDNSLDITIPYYLNLAPNYDLILAPRYVEKHGEALASEFRYLAGYGEWGLKSSYLPNDQQTDENRWLVGLTESGYFTSSWSSKIDYNRVSDSDYFTDLGLSSIALKRSTHLNQQAALQYYSDNWTGLLEVQRYQTIAAVEDPYQKMPQLSLRYQSPTRNFALEPNLEVEYSRFDHRDSYGDGGTKITGERVYNTVGASLPMRWRWGYIEPSINNRYVAYQLDDADLAGVNSSPDTNSVQIAVDSGLYFERSLEIKDTPLTHTLEPRLYYRFAEYQNQDDQPDFDSAALTFTYQQLFRDSRFTGHDRLDDADQISIGVSSRLIDEERGREFLSASIGQIYYFDDRKVQLPGDVADKSSASDVAGQVRLITSLRSSISADVLVDPDLGVINQSNLSYHRRSDNGGLFNVAYTTRRAGNQFGGLEQDVTQLDASASIPLNNQWKLFARSQYDLEDSRPMENLFGAEYQNCCWLARVVYQQALEPDDTSGSNTGTTTNSAILVEFQLKGLGGLGTAVTNVLEESIFGYQSDK